MGHRIQLEIERKYDVTRGTTPPDLVGVGAIAVMESPTGTDLVAVYYDTDRLDITRSRRALRRRTGGDDAGWHLKVAPAEAEGRTEHHWPLTDDEVVPEDIVRALAAVTEGRPLRPVARVANHRLTTRLLDAAGYPLAELCDDHVLAEDLRDGSRRGWQEWEVELSAAAPEHPAARSAFWSGIERQLTAAGARPSSSESKLARALGIDPMPSVAGS